MSITRFEFTSRVRPVLEVGIGSTIADDEATALWDVALWDAAGSLWNGVEPFWRDVGCDAITATIDIGRGRVSDPFPVGIANVTVDNASGWADPSTDFDTETLAMRPGRPIRIGVEHVTLGTHWLYRGFIDEILPRDDPQDWSTVVLECIDALGEAGRAKLAGEIETGAGELASVRFGRILDEIAWPTDLRDISASAVRSLYAAELNGQVVDLLRQTAESEGGWCFGDTDGNIVLQDRDWLYYEVGAAVDDSIGNVPDPIEMALTEAPAASGLYNVSPITENPASSGLYRWDGSGPLVEGPTSSGLYLIQTGELPLTDVCPGAWVRSFARRDIATRVILDVNPSSDITPDPDPVILDDPAAQALYGIEPFVRGDMWTDNVSARIQNAGRILATRNARTSMPRIKSVTINASASGNRGVDLLTELSIFTPSRYRGRLQTDRGLVFDESFYAVGVRHTIDASTWEAEISLDRASPFELLDPADYVWNVARWDSSLWN